MSGKVHGIMQHAQDEPDQIGDEQHEEQAHVPSVVGIEGIKIRPSALLFTDHKDIVYVIDRIKLNRDQSCPGISTQERTVTLQKYEGKDHLSFINKKGKKIGTVSYYYDNKLISKEDIVLNTKIHMSIKKILKEYFYVFILIILIIFYILIKPKKKRKKKTRII